MRRSINIAIGVLTVIALCYEGRQFPTIPTSDELSYARKAIAGSDKRGALYGRVTMPDGSPVGNMPLVLDNFPTVQRNGVMAKTLSSNFLRTDKDGYYFCVPDHWNWNGPKYVLTVASYTDGTKPLPAPLPIYLNQNEPQLPRNFVLRPNARVVGTVTDEEGKPVQSLRLSVPFAPGYLDGDINRTYTNTQGRFEMAVPSGKCFVELTVLSNQQYHCEPLKVNAQPGQTVSLAMRVTRIR